MQTPWWKKRVFYQIYPRSFQDSNGDGIGDLRGILSRLDYLQWLGVGAVWLCPVYDSPNADMGYDIRDYEAIMQEFGTMEDFDALLDGLHQRDIKLVMDLVVNHSSDEHRWFVESRKSKDNPYRDYYIWRDGKDGKEPNNWASFFTPSAWSYDQQSGQWYLHLFAEKQPDLNWENPALREEIYAMINRWFDKGVDGFRMDVISLLAKDPSLPDGKGDGYVCAPEYFAFQPKLHDYLREMCEKCFDGRDCMCVGETAFVNTRNAPSVVGDGRELDLLFQFDLMDIDGGSSKWDVIPFDLKKYKTIMSSWQEAIDWNTLFLGNHDQPRIRERVRTREELEPLCRFAETGWKRLPRDLSSGEDRHPHRARATSELYGGLLQWTEERRSGLRHHGTVVLFLLPRQLPDADHGTELSESVPAATVKVTVPPLLGTLVLLTVTVGAPGKVFTFTVAYALLIEELYPLTLPFVTILK